MPILRALQKRLGVDDRRKTTEDMLFTVETVACLGACGLAPVVVIDDQVHGQQTPRARSSWSRPSSHRRPNERCISLPTKRKRNGRTAQRRVIVCAGTGCVASGAYNVFQALVGTGAGRRPPVAHRVPTGTRRARLRLNKSGCQGFCQMGPLVTVLPEGILYTQGQRGGRGGDCRETLVGRRAVERLLYVDPGDARSAAGAWTRFRSTSASSASCCATAAPSIPRASRNTCTRAATRRRGRPYCR